MRWVFWGLTILVAVAAAIFAVFNRTPVTVDCWPFPMIELPLFVLVLGTLVVGFLVGRITAWASHLKVRRERSRLAKQIQVLAAEKERNKPSLAPDPAAVAATAPAAAASSDRSLAA
jgi:lipopolysaccharide assembly protein A